MFQSKTKAHSLSIKQSFTACFLGFLLLCTVGCNEEKLKSNWLDREIIIDAKSDDWLDTLYYFESEMVSIGFFNDESHLYVCMLAENPMLQMQIVGQGFTLWFDPDGGKEKSFGIKFPIGMREAGAQMDFQGMQGGSQDREKMREAFEQSLTDFEILGSRGAKRRIPVEEAPGIEIKARNETGLFVYELRVPLQSDEAHPYAVGANAGDAIGLGLEIPQIDRDEMKKAVQERMGEAGMPPPPDGGGGMGGRGGGMGRSGGHRPQIPNGLDVWASLQLASNQNQKSAN